MRACNRTSIPNGMLLERRLHRLGTRATRLRGRLIAAATAAPRLCRPCATRYTATLPPPLHLHQPSQTDCTLQLCWREVLGMAPRACFAPRPVAGQVRHVHSLLACPKGTDRALEHATARARQALASQDPPPALQLVRHVTAIRGGASRHSLALPYRWRQARQELPSTWCLSATNTRALSLCLAALAASARPHCPTPQSATIFLHLSRWPLLVLAAQLDVLHCFDDACVQKKTLCKRGMGNGERARKRKREIGTERQREGEGGRERRSDSEREMKRWRERERTRERERKCKRESERQRACVRAREFRDELYYTFERVMSHIFFERAMSCIWVKFRVRIMPIFQR